MRHLLYVLLSCILALPSIAQVTIGSAEKPNAGALLDIKQYKGSNSATASKGLLLPRVALVALDKLSPMYSYDDDANIPTQTVLKTHTGLVVYNQNDTEGLADQCPTGLSSGLYVWDGLRWEPLLNDATDYLGERLKNASIMVDNRDASKSETYNIGYFQEAGWWMLENLRATMMPDGTPIERGTLGNYIFGVKYNYPSAITSSTPSDIDGDENLFKRNPELGLLYSWEAATNKKPRINDDDSATDTGLQGICPEGWHLPSRNEWIELFNVINKLQNHDLCVYATDPLLNALNPDFPLDDRACMALISSHKIEGALIAPPGKSVSKEEGGFNFLPTGIRTNGGYAQYGNYARAWTSSRKDQYNSYMTAINMDNLGRYRDEYHVTHWYSNSMVPVRCKRN